MYFEWISNQKKTIFLLLSSIFLSLFACGEKKMRKAEHLLLVALRQDTCIHEQIKSPKILIFSVDSIYTTYVDSKEYQELNAHFESFNRLFDEETKKAKKSISKKDMRMHYKQAHAYVDSAHVYADRIKTFRGKFTRSIKEYEVKGVFYPHKSNEAICYNYQAIITPEWKSVYSLEVEKCKQKP